jgi:transposase
MIDVSELLGTVFPGLSALVIEDVEDAGDVICVQARTRGGAVACPGCGAETARVHEYRERTAADVPVDGRRVLVKVRVRRMRCPALDCKVQTFREQVPGVLDRYQRRISRLTAQVSAVARELAGRASARLLPALGITVSRHTALRLLLKVPLPALAVPRVLVTASRCAAAWSTRPCSSTPRPAAASTCCPAAPQTWSGNGCAGTRK